MPSRGMDKWQRKTRLSVLRDPEAYQRVNSRLWIVTQSPKRTSWDGRNPMNTRRRQKSPPVLEIAHQQMLGATKNEGGEGPSINLKTAQKGGAFSVHSTLSLGFRCQALTGCLQIAADAPGEGQRHLFCGRGGWIWLNN